MRKKFIYLTSFFLLWVALGSDKIQADVAESLAGLWEFDNPTNLTEATVGNDLILVGAGQAAVTGINGSDGAVAVDLGTYYQCNHGIAANGGGDYVNEYSLLFDVMYPSESAGKWRAFYQTGYDTYNDSDYFIHPSDESWGVGDLGYTDNATVGEWYSSDSTWYRVVLTVNLDTPGAAFFDLYINGELKGQHNTANLGLDGRFALYTVNDENPYLVFCGDDNGDDALMHFSNIAIWGRSLTPEEIAELGSPGDPILSSGAPAWQPQPEDDATEVSTYQNLSWSPGPDAVSHDVYFGTDNTDVASGSGGTFQGNQTTTDFDPGTLLVATTYYWRIDEKASDGTTTHGDVWSFTTADFVIVDDFEDYNDYPPDEIYTTWEDGLTDPANGGSQVGYLTVPAVETQLVHGGVQSMPLLYDNSTVSYSEAVRTFDTPQDFSTGGLSGLTLWHLGQPAAVGGLSVDQATQTHTLTGSGADIGGSSDEFHYAFKQLNGPASITVKVESITDTHSWAKAGVMVRETLEADSLYAMVVVTPSGRVAFEFRSTLGLDSHSTHTATDTISFPHWVRLSRSATNLFTAEHSADGINWEPVESDDPQDPSVWNVLMNQDAYIGLAVTAHDDKAVCEATFSNITVTGGVSPGPFTESQDVGIKSNSPEPIYLRLEDNAGTAGTVYHEGGHEAVLATDWQLWGISLEDFQAKGVDITSVRKIVIGVGDKDNQQLGGTGKLLIDDIHAVRRIPTSGSILLFEEDFENLVLGPSVDEDDAPADNEAWTEIPPSGWIIDDSGVPGAGDPTNDGATEWAGWSFAKKAWWEQIGQERQLFELANGIVAIADADEWDDFDHPSGMMNALLSTPEIDITAIESGSGKLQLIFDSSWRREDTQTASVTAQFDDGDPIEILRWESEGGDPAYLKDDAVSETVSVNIDKPAGTKKMVLTFAMLNAGNDWWWAIDNIQINGIPRERTVIFAEDFEGLELGPSVEENPGLEEAWTDTPPAGWFVDESAVPGAGDPDNDGVTEWAGWSFADKDFWINTDFQRRDEFELGQGTIAVADSDEYADASHPSGSYDTYLTTPEIDISGIEVGTLQLKFDSSWRPEVIQTANITVQYDGADPEEVLRWESQPGSNFKDDNSTNETIIVNLDNPPGAMKVVLTFGYFNTDNNWWWAIDNIEVSALPREKVCVFTEDFEGLPLGPNVDESVAGDEVWTKTAPEGWTLDDSGVPGLDEPENGVTEWAGWSFADNDWWASVDDQRRSEFELAIGTVAVADSDEYADKGDPAGTYNAFMSTPPIDISNLEAGTAELTFDSSWLPESSQTASITASYDGSEPVEVMLWVSDSGNQFYHDNNTNETVTIPLENPEGAQNVALTFGYYDASNNWWWAIDNVTVCGYLKGGIPPILVFSEKFNGVTLTPSVDEAPPGNYWTKTPPAGWAIDDSQMAGFGDPATDGVTDWAGWCFADKDFWISAEDQNRSQFVLGTGTVAIADPDEWDDLPHADGTFNSFLDTAPIDISGVDAGSVELKFDSSWLPEFDDYYHQTAELAVSFDGGNWVRLFLWESDSSSVNYKAGATNETVTVSIDNPAGAQSMVLDFGLWNAGNDWWWAFDNVEVTGTSAGDTVQLLMEDFEGLPLGPSPEEAPPGSYWTDVPPEGWIVDDSGVPGAGDPANDGVTEWAGWSFVSKSWWIQVAGDQDRSQFDNGNAVVAVADPDEWDDMDHLPGLYNAFLSTPVIDITGIEANTLRLTFDSSWRQEDTQTANVTVSYDGGAPIEILRWESAGGDTALLKPDNTNEAVSVELNNPDGAHDMVITFGMLDASDDWWWAIDNIKVISYPSE